MRSFLFVFALVSMSFVTSANSADIAIRPGLWEINTSSALLDFASQIPPDQMKNLNEFAKEYGFDVPEIHNGSAKSTTCITQEMAQQKVLPGSFQNQAGCAINKVTQNGNYYRVDFACVNSQFNGNGTAEGNFTNAETFTGLTKFNGSIQNNAVNEQANVNGKWLANSCENKKSLQQ